jgi:hypothetical protein
MGSKGGTRFDHLGVKKKQSHNWQKLAALEEKAFEEKAKPSRRRAKAKLRRHEKAPLVKPPGPHLNNWNLSHTNQLILGFS